LAEASGFDAVKNLDEEGDVAIDEIETGFVGFAAEAGGNEENVAVGGVVVIACVNLVVAGESAAVVQVERFAFSKVFIGVEQLNLCHQPSALKCVSCARANSSPSTDNRHFHIIPPCS